LGKGSQRENGKRKTQERKSKAHVQTDKLDE